LSKLKDRIKQAGSIKKLADQMDHTEVFITAFPDRGSHWMGPMMDAINAIDGAKEFITTRYISLNNPDMCPSDEYILNRITGYPSVYDCGHTGCTMAFTLNSVQYYLREGRVKVLKKRLNELKNSK